MENKLINISEKDRVIADTMAIRAGLSLISKFTSEIKAEEAFQEDKRKHIEIYNNKCNQHLNDKIRIEKQRQQHQKECDSLEEEIRNLSAPPNIENERRTEAAKFKPWQYRVVFNIGAWAKVFGILFGISYLLLMILSAILDNSIKNISEDVYVIISILFVVAPSVLSYPIWYFFKCKEKKKCTQAEIEMNVQRTINERNERLGELKESLTKAQRDLKNSNQLINTIEEYIHNAEKNIASAQKEASDEIYISNQRIAIIAKQAQAVNENLFATYNATISQSDWGNIDLIIHYLETGRADTLKEALCQVDQQKQNDRIVAAISEAANSINMHIDNAFSNMAYALSQSFSRLEQGLNRIKDELRENHSASYTMNAQLIGKLQEQISISQMNAALLEKANYSSEKLLDDLRYNQRFWVK